MAKIIFSNPLLGLNSHLQQLYENVTSTGEESLTEIDDEEGNFGVKFSVSSSSSYESTDTNSIIMVTATPATDTSDTLEEDPVNREFRRWVLRIVLKYNNLSTSMCRRASSSGLLYASTEEMVRSLSVEDKLESKCSLNPILMATYW